MNLLVFGAAGRTGRLLVARALTDGHCVTAFVRSPTKLAMEHPNLRVAEGTAIDSAAVRDAVVGQNAVFSTLGNASPLRRERDLVNAIGHIVKAMEENGPRRIIYLS